MKSIITALMLVMLAISATTVKAEGECDKFYSSYDKTYCFSKLFVESDKELNSVYADLRAKLKADTKRQLTETQRDWMKYRDSTCEQTPGEINVDCNYKVNRERTDYLRDRLRECKTGNCREDMIVQPGWN